MNDSFYVLVEFYGWNQKYKTVEFCVKKLLEPEYADRVIWKNAEDWLEEE